MLASTFVALAGAAVVSAHTVITYPGWRGDNLITNETFPYGMQWMYPCKSSPSLQEGALSPFSFLLPLLVVFFTIYLYFLQICFPFAYSSSSALIANVRIRWWHGDNNKQNLLAYDRRRHRLSSPVGSKAIPPPSSTSTSVSAPMGPTMARRT